MATRIKQFLYPEDPFSHLVRREPGTVGSNPGDGTISVWENLPYYGPWSNNNYLGASRKLVEPSQLTGAPVNLPTPLQVLKLPEWGPPVRWTVTVGIDGIDSSDVTSLYQLYGNITIGSGGTTQSFTFDWLNGFTFPVTANSIDISVVHDIPPSNPLPITSRANVLLARGACNNFATRTVSQAVLATAFSSYVLIPPFAKRMKIIPQSTVAGDNAVLYHVNSRIEQWKVPNITIASCQQLELIMNSAGYCITPGARFVRIYNGSASAFNYAAQFELSL